MKKIFLFLIIAGFFLLSVGCSLSKSSSSASANVDEQNAPTPVTCDPSVVVNPPAQGQPKCEDYLGTWQGIYAKIDFTFYPDGASSYSDRTSSISIKWQYNANKDGRIRTLSPGANYDVELGFEDLSDLTKLCQYDAYGCNPALAYDKQP